MLIPERLPRQLAARAQQGILRLLPPAASGLIDFSSNDYLGLASSPLLAQLIAQELEGKAAHGATGSRLLSGNTAYAQELEDSLAIFHGAEAALLFNSGYAANCGFFSSVPQRGDTILYDEASHASIKDGIRLSFAQSFSFRHNDLDDLQVKLKRAQGDVFVAVESLYSMDGDFAPLAALAALSQEKGLYLVVDEAHSNGLFGPNGEGLISGLGLEQQVFARIMTFGKALGVHGAAVVGPKILQQFLLNFSRPFIYTTALPLASLVAIKNAYQVLPTLKIEREKVQILARLYQSLQPQNATFSLFPEKEPLLSPIQAWHLADPSVLRQISIQLQAVGFDVKPVFSPTVPAGKERLRLVLHAYNTPEQIQQLCRLLAPNAIL